MSAAAAPPSASPGNTVIPTNAANSYTLPTDYTTSMAIIALVVPCILTFYAGVVLMYYFNALGLQTFFRNSLLVAAFLLSGQIVYALMYDTSRTPLPTHVIMSLLGSIVGIIPVFIALMYASSGSRNSSLSGGNNSIKISHIGNNAPRNNANRNSKVA
jgi:hypothetical protein